MKKVLFTLVLMLTAFSAKAMSYQQARDQALFLTDKMAYELDLTEEQYEAAFEVNLDYLMSVNTVDDVYSVYWTRRNLDLSYILYDWQYRTFCGLEYFYRPLYWGNGFWHFRIYAYYPHRHYHYFGYPGCYYSYRGAHSWHANGGHSYYHGRHFTTHDHGMRGGWDRGGYRNMNQGWYHKDGGNRGFDPHSPAPNNRPGNHRPGSNRPDNGSHGNVGGHNSSSHGNAGASRPNGGTIRPGHSTVTGERNNRYGSGSNRYGSGSNTGTANRRQDGNSSFSNGDTPRSSTRETARGHRTDGGTSYTPSRSFSGSGSSSSYRSSSSGRSYNSGRSVGSSSSSRSSYSGSSSSSRSSYSRSSSSSRSVGHSYGTSSRSSGSSSRSSGSGHFGGGHR